MNDIFRFKNNNNSNKNDGNEEEEWKKIYKDHDRDLRSDEAKVKD